MQQDTHISDAAAAAAFRRLVAHLQHRHDAQNIDLMGLAGFCRNCLADWVMEGMSGIELVQKIRTDPSTPNPFVPVIMLTGHSTDSDTILGLAFARTGVWYPFFGTLLGWLGVALTGSDTSSNALFGSLQRITAEQLGLNPVLIVASNSTGGVMGKMIDAQSIVVAGVATGQHGQVGDILRYVFWHSLALACLVGVEIFVMAHW